MLESAPEQIPASEVQPAAPDRTGDLTDTATNFSPQAAIAAFGGLAQSCETPPAAEFAVPPISALPVGTEATPLDSPFRIDVEAEPVLQAFQADPPAAESQQPEHDQASTDRVDELQKQFHERYGKP